MAESDDLRAFIRDIMARFDRGMAAQAARDQEYFEKLHAQGERESRRVDELIAESRAQRQALLHILDEMRGGNGGTAPAG
jgi:hypothetical protein